MNVVFNPAAAVVDGETVLLARVERSPGSRISRLRARRTASTAGASRPSRSSRRTKGVESEQWGFEDARAVWVDELDRFAITCTAYGPAGPAVYLATTKDFSTVERHGIVITPEDKNAALLPERVDGRWILFHRPTTGFGVTHPGIALSRSPDLVNWSPPESVLKPREGAWWDSLRIGIGPPLLKTEHGWLLIYHGVKETVGGAIYRVGLALLDLEEPTRVLQRAAGLDLRAAGAVRAAGRRRRTRSSPAASPRRLVRRASAVLRRRGYVDLSRDRAARRAARRDPQPVTVTGTPAPIRPASQVIAAVSRRMQPWDTAVPRTPPTFARPVQCDLPRSSFELLQDVRAGAQRERVRRADFSCREPDRLLDEERPGRRRRRRLADDRAKDLDEASLVEHAARAGAPCRRRDASACT